jgi:transcriptional regulator with XRE-family HTH domain
MIQLQIKKVITTRSLKWVRDITMLEVAKASGMSRTTLYRAINNEHNVSINALDRLRTFFEGDIQDLMKYTPTQRKIYQKMHLSLAA